MLLTRRETRSAKRFRYRLSFGKTLLFSVLAAGFPAVAIALILLWAGRFSLDHKWEGTSFILVSWIGLSFSARGKFIYSVQALANVVGSLKEEDFSFRATKAIQGDALGELAMEINNLARALEDQRLGTIEAANLLRKVMAEVGTAIVAFSPDGRVHLLNRTATTLLGGHEEQILHRSAAELKIEDLVEGPASETMTRSFGGMERRWLVRRSWFRQHGLQHRLVVLSEASEALRAEERTAWQRLIRVLSHEINNSLAPIKSIARSLTRISERASLPEDDLLNLKHGLEVIGGRADSLNRFLQNYAQLAKLPPPNKRGFALRALMQHVVGLEARIAITLRDCAEVDVIMDPDQLEHALINIIKNAVDAVLARKDRAPSADSVVVSWEVSRNDLEILVSDLGIGLQQTENLLVPFYTTKQTGSGIGLILARQIVENHSGVLAIWNRTDQQGCQVVLKIPSCLQARDAPSI